MQTVGWIALMGMTMAERALARASGKSKLAVGDIVVCEVDRIVILDMFFTTKSEPAVLRIADPDRTVVLLDHAVPAPTVRDAEGHILAREFASRFGITRFFDVGRHGIVHQFLMEQGLAVPGQLLACSDSHTCSAGALNVAARGLGRLEMMQVLCTGTTWYRVCPTIRYDFTGTLRDGAYGKDVFLYVAQRYGDHANLNLEFAGEGLAALALDDRTTIATMCAEINAEFAMFPVDRTVERYLEDRVSATLDPVAADPDAVYLDRRTIDLDEIVPYVCLPDFVPHNAVPVRHLPRVPIDQAFVGSCANGKLEDLRTAAQIVKGKTIADGVRFIVTPASQLIYLDAVRLGYVADLVEAGAVVTNATCGACQGYHMGVLGPGETCVTSSTRNFKGRMGSTTASIYMASSATVAASALAGHIVDPRQALLDSAHGLLT